MSMSDVTELSDHAWSQEQIAAHLAGGLSASETERLEAHVRNCARCSASLESAKRLDRGMNSLFATVQPGPEFEHLTILKLREGRGRVTLQMPFPRWPRRALAAAAALLFLGTFGALAASIVGDGRIPMPGDDPRALFARHARNVRIEAESLASNNESDSYRAYNRALDTVQPQRTTGPDDVRGFKSFDQDTTNRDSWAGQPRTGETMPGAPTGPLYDPTARPNTAPVPGMPGPPGGPGQSGLGGGEGGVSGPPPGNGYSVGPGGPPPGGGFPGGGGIGGIGGGIGGGGIGGIGGIGGGFGGNPMGQPNGAFRPTPFIQSPPGRPMPSLNDVYSVPSAKPIDPATEKGVKLATSTYFRPGEGRPAAGEKTTAVTPTGQPNPSAQPEDGNKGDKSLGKGEPQAGQKDQQQGGGEGNPKKGNEQPPAVEPEPARRIVIRSGDMEFVVDSFDASLETITKLVTGIKGAFVATVNSDKLSNGKVKGSVTVRTPPEALDSLVLALRKELGATGELKGVKISSQDITKMYTDLESRLRAARTMETRLLQIIKEGKGDIKQLLEAERELGVWRTKIEEQEGEIRYYSNLASLSSLTIGLTEREIRAAAGLTEKERVQAGVEVEDVDKAYQQVLAAIVEAKGRVMKSELKQLAAGQFNATLNFEVAPEAAGPIRDRLRQLGRVARLEIDRVQQADGTLPSDAKLRRGDTVFMLQLYNLANIAPRETATLQVAVADVPTAYQNLRDEVAKTAGRVLVAQLNEQDKQNVTGQLDFEVRRTEEGKIRAALAGAGEIVSRQVVRAPESDSVTDVKVMYRTNLMSASRLRPRETATFQIAVSDVSVALQALRDTISKTPSRVVNAQFDEQDRQNASAQLDFEVKRGEEAAVRAALDAAGEVVSRQVTRTPEADGFTDAKVLYRATLLGANRLRSRDTAMVQVAVVDVPPAYHAIREAVAKANGRLIASQLDEHDKQNITAQIDFVVKRADEAAMRAALDAAGDTIARQVTRATEGDGVTDTKVTYRVTLLSANRLRPRETMTLAVEVPDVTHTAAAFANYAAEAKGRQVDARINRESSGKVTAHLVYDVPLSSAAGLAEQFKSAGTVRVQQSARDPQAPDGKYATARLDVTLTSAEKIVADDAGVWPQVKRGLSYSASVLLMSLTWVVFGLCVVLPWALIGFGGYRAVRWMSRPEQPATAATTPPAPPIGG